MTKIITNKKLFNSNKKIKSNKLVDRFLVPPFSVFDARQGYWMKRKGEWLNLGIKSELGRGDNLTFGMACFNYDMEKELKSKYGKCLPDSIGENYNRKSVQATSIFDPVLCEIIYRWFSNIGDLVLDPFAGGSVRGIVAGELERNYIGIDLRKEQVDANIQNWEEINQNDLNANFKPKWIVGDSLNIKDLTENVKADLIFSCPPYYNLEVYSDLENDISNKDTYEEFLDTYEKIIKNSVELLKENSFAVFVVGEFRDKKGFYCNFVGDTIKAFEKAGMNYYNEGILVTPTGTLPVRTAKQFNSGRKLGKQHQNILIFYKGNVSEIKQKFKELDLGVE